MIPVTIHGAEGRMGRLVTALVDQAADCELVALISEPGREEAAGTWHPRLPLTGQEGWAAARFIEIGLGSIYDLPVVDGGTPPPPPGQATAYVTTYQLNVRGGPGLTYNIIGRLWVLYFRLFHPGFDFEI